MTRILGWLLQALGRYLLVFGLLVVLVIGVGAGRSAWTHAVERSLALDRARAEEARAQQEAVGVRSALLTAASDRDALRARLVASARSTLAAEDQAVQAALAQARQRLRQGEQELIDLRRDLTADARAAVRSSTRTLRDCEGLVQFVKCQWARVAYELAQNQLAAAEAQALDQVQGLRVALDRRQGELNQLLGHAAALRAQWEQPLGEGERRLLASADADVASTEAALAAVDERLGQARAERRLLEASQGAADHLRQTLEEDGLRLGGLALLILSLPYLRKCGWYFLLMPLAERRPAICLLPPALQGEADAAPSAPEQRVVVPPGAVLRVRPAYVGRRDGRPDTEWVYGGWRHPFTSLLAGLTGLDRFVSEHEQQVTVGNPSDPDSQLLRLDLSEHPGFVVHPAAVVAVLGDLRMTRRWRVAQLHSWLTFQFRYLLFEGTGTLVLEGRGNVAAERAAASVTAVPAARVVGFDGRLAYRSTRTRPFWPYFSGARGLVEDAFVGPHVFVVEKVSREEGPRSMAQRTFDLFFGALEKVLGI